MILRGLCLAAIFGIGLPLSASVLVSSNWDNAADGVDGWSFIADGSNLIRVATGGNPGGFLQVSDTGAGSVIFWEAPAKFLSDKSAAYGGTLNYDLQQSEGDRQSSGDIPEVVLIGNGITLTFDLPNSSNPAVTPNWASYTFALLASAGWIDDDTSLPATELQMQSVLANLSNIEIRAEYSAARDIDGIDNVTLTSTSTPEPVTSALLICGGFFMLIHRRIWMRG
jgi:Laminin B (Domain IV)